MQAKCVAIMLGFGLLAGGASAATAQVWRIRAAAGLAYNVPVRLSVTQVGQPEIRTRARFETRSLEPPIHWVVRVERDAGSTRWALELMHDKLYLTDPPPAIDHFEITHGFNVVSLLRGWTMAGTDLGLGIGAIVGHPENTVRGRRLEPDGVIGGYYLSGAALHASAGRSLRLWRGLHLFGELRAMGARVHVPVDGGDADFWHLSGHALAGVGFGFDPGR
jgi:hypothetical protein